MTVWTFPIKKGMLKYDVNIVFQEHYVPFYSVEKILEDEEEQQQQRIEQKQEISGPFPRPFSTTLKKLYS